MLTIPYEKKLIVLGTLSIIICFYSTILGLDNQLSSSEKKLDYKEFQPLKTTIYKYKGNTHQLTLFKSERAFSSSNGKYNDFKSIVFYVVDSPLGNFVEKRLIWSCYQSGSGTPLPEWSADIVWNSKRNRAYLIIIESIITSHINITTYEIDPDKEATPFWMNQFDHLKIDTWPKSPDPINIIKQMELHRQMYLKSRPTGIQEIHALSETDHLFIYSEMENKDLKPRFFRFNLDKKQWKEIIIREGRLADYDERGIGQLKEETANKSNP